MRLCSSSYLVAAVLFAVSCSPAVGTNDAGAGGGLSGTGGGLSGTGGGTSGTGGGTTGGGASGTGGGTTAGGSSGTGGGTTAGGSSGTGGGTTAGGSSGTGGGTTAGGTSGTGGGTTAGGSSGTGGGSVTLPDGGLPRFSFFVVSHAAVLRVSNNPQGFGGDLRRGDTGLGAGLRGADRTCTELAERSMPGAGAKVWRAFLSADQGEDGGVVHARDRIGNGPWYDRQGRLFAMTLSQALTTRPTGCDSTICNDLPNEDGVPNHGASGMQVDNHDTLTGSSTMGMNIAGRNCRSWTTNATDAGTPQLGHSWPASSGQSWTTVHLAGGCGAGINLQQTGGPNAPTVGAGGGYGGWYCFALTP